jgi:hypothetical protein
LVFHAFTRARTDALDARAMIVPRPSHRARDVSRRRVATRSP